MAAHSRNETSVLDGLWLGGTFEEVRPVSYIKPGTEQELNFQLARFHVPGEDARYQSVTVDEGIRLALPTDKPVLINVRAFISKDVLRIALAKDYPKTWWMPAPEIANKDGELVGMTGLFAVGRFHSEQKREWRDKTTGKLAGIRYLKLHLPRPVEPDYLMAEIDPATTLPPLTAGAPITVPLSASASKRGVRFRLLTEFKPFAALTPDLTDAA